MYLAHLGRPAQGWEVFRRARHDIPAYQAFLRQHASDHLVGEGEWASIPCTSKANYIKSYALAEREASNDSDTVTYFRSSGISGTSTYWPYSRQMLERIAEGQRPWFEANFGIHCQKTLVLIAFTGGGWLARELMTWVFRQFAQRPDYELHVIVPENDPEELCRVIDAFGQRYESILLCTMPFIARNMMAVARQQNLEFPMNKLHFYLSGELFDEQWRQQLRDDIGGQCRIMSTYGATDVGAIGFESVASMALRNLLVCHQGLRQLLQCPDIVPGFYHMTSVDGFLEVVEGSLVITRWQGVPLVRYDIGDKVSLLDWGVVKSQISRWASSPGLALSTQDKQRLQSIATSRPGLTNLIAIEGRIQEGHTLMGIFIARTTLEAIVSELMIVYQLTGAYLSEVGQSEEGEYLSLCLECHAKTMPKHSEVTEITTHIHAALCQYESLWSDMVRESYTKRGLDLALACRVQCVAHPNLSQSETKQIKVRRVTGP